MVRLYITVERDNDSDGLNGNVRWWMFLKLQGSLQKLGPETFANQCSRRIVHDDYYMGEKSSQIWQIAKFDTTTS